MSRKSVSTFALSQLFVFGVVLMGMTGYMLAGCQAPKSEYPSSALENSPGGNTPAPATDTFDSSIQNQSDEVVEIKENLFIGQLNDIYLNQSDYVGKTIKYEGMLTSYTWEEEHKTYYLVYRKSPGCCGADGQAGFEVVWAEGTDKKFPKENDWCEVVGVLEQYEEYGVPYVRIVLSTLTVKQERGAEFVSQ